MFCMPVHSACCKNKKGEEVNIAFILGEKNELEDEYGNTETIP